MDSSKTGIGAVCYSKAVPGAYGSVVVGRIRDDVRNAVGSVIEKAIQEAIVRHVGIDLSHPDDEVHSGDRVLLPGGHYEEIPEEDYSQKDVDALVEVLGISTGDDDTTLSRVMVLTEELRVRLGDVLQSLTGDGCDDVADGVRGIEKWIKEGGIKKLALSILGPQDTDQSLSELLGLALKERPYQEILQELQERNEEAGAIRVRLSKYLGNRKPEDSPETVTMLETILMFHDAECERRQSTQDRVQALLLRLVGECGEGLSTKTMLDRIEASLGPVPEF